MYIKPAKSEKETAYEMKEKRKSHTKDNFIYAFCLKDQATHELLVLQIMFLGHLDGLVMGVHGLQLAPQIFPILSKGVDLA